MTNHLKCFCMNTKLSLLAVLPRFTSGITRRPNTLIYQHWLENYLELYDVNIQRISRVSVLILLYCVHHRLHGFIVFAVIIHRWYAQTRFPHFLPKSKRTELNQYRFVRQIRHLFIAMYCAYHWEVSLEGHEPYLKGWEPCPVCCALNCIAAQGDLQCGVWKYVVWSKESIFCHHDQNCLLIYSNACYTNTLCISYAVGCWHVFSNEYCTKICRNADVMNRVLNEDKTQCTSVCTKESAHAFDFHVGNEIHSKRWLAKLVNKGAQRQ